MMNFPRLGAMLLFGAILLGNLKAQEENPFGAFRVAGYLPDYRLAEFRLDSSTGWTDLILFSAEAKEDGSLDLRRLSNCPWKSLLEFKTKYRQRLFLTVGGWGRSSHFAKVAANEEARRRFVASAVEIALEKRLDGIDLDWEHPVDKTEENLYGELLAALRKGLSPHGLMLTVTIAGWQNLTTTAIESVDAVQLMAYDDDGEHATVGSCQRDIQRLLNAGIPPYKIVLGLPFYGRHVENRQAMTYREIVAKAAGNVELLAGDRLEKIYFNGPKTMAEKTRIAIQSKLSGVMVWEIAQDAVGDHSLHQAIVQTLESQMKQPRE